MGAGIADRLELSIVVISFNMNRELPRTLYSLSPAYQRGIEADEYEVIVVDNGSAKPPAAEDFEGLGIDLRVLGYPEPAPSPVKAINYGLSLARAPLMGVMIDGARMVTPGFLDACRRAARIAPRVVVSTLSFQIGPDLQWISMQQGYDQAWEDRLLEGIDWPRDGYRLFDISPTVENAHKGWFGPLNETNALFMTRPLWQELGGYDPAFVCGGGGAVNPDALWRALELPGVRQVVVLGEGTFHQVHGGITTNSGADSLRHVKEMAREYIRLRGRPPKPVDVERVYFGPVSRAAAAAYQRQLSQGAGAPPATYRMVGDAQALGSRYMELLKKVLLNETGLEIEAALQALRTMERIPETFWKDTLYDVPAKLGGLLRGLQQRRALGRDVDAGGDLPPLAYTMIGRKRLEHLEWCVNAVLDEGLPGDLIECGVWRGGAALLMQAVLVMRGEAHRRVWLADSFEGIPPPQVAADGVTDWSKAHQPWLAVSQTRVEATFATFGLSGPNLRFLPGWFKDSLPQAGVERLALLRLDGDLYSSTMDALDNLYDRVVEGGFVIVDDYGGVAQCAAAVNAFRSARGITDPIRMIDWCGAYWRKSRPPTPAAHSERRDS